MTENQLRNAMTTYGNTVYRLALCRLQNIADAEDVYQDVFLRLFSQTETDWEGEHLKAWLIRTTLNRCADLYRFRLRRPVLSLEEIADVSGVSEEAYELWEAVSQLPEKLRTPIHLHYGEGYSTGEIAAMMKIPAATIRTRLHRGREKLKTLKMYGQAQSHILYQ